MKRWFLLFAALILLPPAIFWWTAQRADPLESAAEKGRTQNQQRLDVHRVALAAMDNLKVAQAQPAWDVLYEATPTDKSVTLNRALNAVLYVDELATTASDAASKPEQETAARRQLPELITKARQTIDDYREANGDPFTATWMTTRVDLREASLLPVSMTKSIRREVFDRLVEQIEGLTAKTAKGDQLILLAGPMIALIDVLEDPINGFPADLLPEAADSMTKLSDLRPSNLFLAVRASQLAITNQSPTAVRLVQRTAGLAKAIEPTLARQISAIGQTPESLINQIVEAIKANQFEDASNQMMLWFNLLNSTELIKTDRRRASPHPLDLVSFDSFIQIARKLSEATPINDMLDPIVLQSQPVRLNPYNTDASAEAGNTAKGNAANAGALSDAGTLVAMVTIDADMDFDEDLVSLKRLPDGDASMMSLALWNATSGSWDAAGELKIDGRWDSMMIADLFVVDSSSAGRIRESTASNQHNTIQSVIVFGESGVRLVAVDARRPAQKVNSSPENNPAQEAIDERKVDQGGDLTLIESESGLEALTQVTAMTTGDLEGDGDLDLIAATKTGLSILINRGNRTFFELDKQVVASTTWAVGDHPVALAIADLDRDLDLDIVTVHRKSGKTGLIENLLHLQFRFQYIDTIPIVKNADSIAVEDLDGNVSWDLVVSSPDQAEIVQSKTVDVGQWKVVRAKTLDWSKAIQRKPDLQKSVGKMIAHTIVADLDNDGFFEAIRRTPEGMACFSLDVVLDGFDKVVAQPISIDQSITPLLVADFNDDRILDLAGARDWMVGGGIETNGSSPVAVAHTAINTTPKVGQAVEVRFKGIDDNNANSGRVNHYAVGTVLELRFGPYYRSRIITEPTTHFGIDGIEQTPNLRAIFPNGLTQTVADVQPGLLLEEEQTLKGSCPYLYAFNGERFEFVTDCLWAAPLGLQTSPGVVVPDRPWEHLKIDGKFLAAREGAYELRVTEELWEVAYFDELKLTAVDHPDHVEVHTNEKVGPPSIAQPKIHAFDRDDLAGVPSRDTDGNDVTERLRTVDQNHVKGFDRPYRQGLCPPHWIELDLSDRIDAFNASRKQIENDHGDDDIQVHLVLTGWILPTDTSLNIQIDQNPRLPSPEPPSLLVPVVGGDDESDRRWKVADPFIGFPGGKNKTIVVDITPHLNRNDPRIRIRTTNQIYWDAARVSVRTRSAGQQIEATVSTTPLPLIDASVGWHGFSKRIKTSPELAETYDYEIADDQPKWPPLGGELTATGPVTDLLRDWDDQMVVISGGDEIRLRFKAIASPERLAGSPERFAGSMKQRVGPTQRLGGEAADEPNGDSLRRAYTRDFILYGVGWDKDADLNTLAGQSTFPLPWRKMPVYPPTAATVEPSAAVRRLNSGHLRRHQPFRSFWKPSQY